MKNITGAQIRAARALLGITAEDLAERSRLGVATIRRAELIDGPTAMTGANDATLRAAIEAAGVRIIEPDEAGGPGVRLKVDLGELSNVAALETKGEARSSMVPWYLGTKVPWDHTKKVPWDQGTLGPRDRVAPDLEGSGGGRSMKVVAVVSQKGGGGKTTVATNLAAASAATGAPTLLLDLDPQQSAFVWGRWRQKAMPKTKGTLTVEAADCGSIAAKLAAAKARGAKLAIIDTPPARGPEADAAAGAAHLVLIVIQPAILDLMTLAETHSLGGVASRSAFVVFNRAPISGSSLADAMERAREAGYAVAPVALSERVVFRAAPVEGRAAFEAERGERKAAAEIDNLYRWMIGELAKVAHDPRAAPALPSFGDPPGDLI